MKRLLLLVIMLNIFSVLSVSAQSISGLRQKAIAESERFWSEVREYNKSQDFELAYKIDTDMPMKKLLLEFERIYKIYGELFEEYYKCFDDDGTNAVSVPGWEMHNLGANNISMAMSIHWKLLKLRMLEQAYFQNPTDQELRNQVLKSRQEFKDSYYNAGYAD